jgi:hypothetical protein
MISYRRCPTSPTKTPPSNTPGHAAWRSLRWTSSPTSPPRRGCRNGSFSIQRRRLWTHSERSGPARRPPSPLTRNRRRHRPPYRQPAFGPRLARPFASTKPAMAAAPEKKAAAAPLALAESGRVRVGVRSGRAGLRPARGLQPCSRTRACPVRRTRAKGGRAAPSRAPCSSFHARDRDPHGRRRGARLCGAAGAIDHGPVCRGHRQHRFTNDAVRGAEPS